MVSDHGGRPVARAEHSYPPWVSESRVNCQSHRILAQFHHCLVETFCYRVLEGSPRSYVFLAVSCRYRVLDGTRTYQSDFGVVSYSQEAFRSRWFFTSRIFARTVDGPLFPPVPLGVCRLCGPTVSHLFRFRFAPPLRVRVPLVVQLSSRSRPPLSGRSLRTLKFPDFRVSLIPGSSVPRNICIFATPTELTSLGAFALAPSASV